MLLFLPASPVVVVVMGVFVYVCARVIECITPRQWRKLGREWLCNRRHRRRRRCGCQHRLLPCHAAECWNASRGASCCLALCCCPHIAAAAAAAGLCQLVPDHRLL